MYTKDLLKTLKNVHNIERLKNKRILIAGASGMVGSALTQMLLLSGCKVYALGRRKARFDHLDKNGVVFIEADLCNAVSVPDDLDYIIHAAGNAYPKAFLQQPAETMLTAVVGTKTFLDYLRIHPCCRLLFVSSGEVYAGSKKDEMLSETDSGCYDLSVGRYSYPIGKAAAEMLCVSYAQEFGISAVTARLCHTFGPFLSENDNRASSSFLREASAGRDIVLTSEGLQERSYAYAPDSASAILTILLNGRSAEAYNVSTGESVSIRKFAEYCAKYGESKVHIRTPKDCEEKERSPIAKQILSPEKLFGLGWKPEYRIEEGIRHSIEIMRCKDGILSED